MLLLCTVYPPVTTQLKSDPDVGMVSSNSKFSDTLAQYPGYKISSVHYLIKISKTVVLHQTELILRF